MPRDSQLNLSASGNNAARRPSFKGSASAATTAPAPAPAAPAPTSRPTSPKSGAKSGTSPSKKAGHKPAEAMGTSLGSSPPEAKRVVMASETLGTVDLDVSELLYGENSVVVMPAVALVDTNPLPGAQGSRPLVVEFGLFLDRPPQQRSQQAERSGVQVGTPPTHDFASLKAEELATEFLRERDMAVRQQYMQMMGSGQADSRAGGMTSATPGTGGVGKEGNNGAGGKKAKG
ncbi:hypothetical protein BCR44DRAFT_44362 [Catenaria anguillulae PL171]|uniref:Uncharacterized protein n=1 Tax=Catenaria anguillulae PL171 TaxID=765915 RepID=A0A1Y2HZH6_9FUNG|nr:hypothetical protein BCR44DRAFT_44362 [Catenaria anguillulae PL171]